MPLAWAQQNIRGVVSDVRGEPIPGANVIEKGTSNGVVTDLNGNFSIQLRGANSMLTVSYIGYVTRELAPQPDMRIVLQEDALNLDEVVVVGYGSVRKKDLTSSITTVNSKDLNMGAYVSIMQAIQGKVPGLSISKDGNPNGGTSILMRGPSTLRTGGAQQPITVVDGVPGGMLSSMDDVVSIDILRDASATAIYGARAANGVIIISTKRGEENASKIAYSAYAGFETISNKIDMMSASEYRKFLQDNGKVLPPVNEDNLDRDWQNEVTRVGISHNNYVSISGGNSKATYFASGAYKSIDGIIRETGRNTMSFMANIQQKAINDRLKVGLTINASVTKGENHPGGEFLFNMLHFWPTVADTNPDGTPKEDLSIGSQNPNNMIAHNTNTFNSKSLLFTGNIQFFLLKNWDVNAYASRRYNQSNNNTYHGKYSRLAQNLNGYAIRNTGLSDMTVMEAFSAYSKNVSGHDFKFMLGYSWQEDVDGDGFQTANTNFVSDATSYNNLALGSGYDGMKIPYGNYGISTLRLISGYFRINYAYRDRYLLQATLRRDGSSAFGENNRWGYFPSVSAGWRITEESFMENQDFFNNLKVRASYGISGNSLGFDPLISKLRYSTLSSGAKFYYQGEYLTPIVPTQNENPDLKWESTSMLNLGLDFAIFNGRLGGTIEWYDKITKDLIWNYPVPATQYYVGTMTANVGEMENKGVEITLNAVPVSQPDVKWNTSFNISFNKNNINSLSSDKFRMDYIHTATGVGGSGQSGNFAQIIQEGYPIGEFFLWEYAGRNSDGVSQFYDKDRNLTITPSSEDHFHVGNAQPKAIFGWHNSFTYKRFNLDFLFRGVTGNQILNVTLADLNYPTAAVRRNMHKMTLKEPINDQNANFTSSRYLEKGDYLRLDNITLSYRIRTNTAYVNNLNVYVTVNNAFVITDYKGLDPEVTLGGITPGIDNQNYYPKTRTFMFGLSVEF